MPPASFTFATSSFSAFSTGESIGPRKPDCAITTPITTEPLPVGVDVPGSTVLTHPVIPRASAATAIAPSCVLLIVMFCIRQSIQVHVVVNI